METFLYTFLGIAVGGAMTYIVSKFYYKKSVKKKSLNAYIQFISEILADIDPEVKKKLHVAYNTQEVDSLYQMQLIIANTGELPIRDVIHPLTLKIPNKGVVLDANIVYIDPEGRESICHITTDEEQNNYVKFEFPLLNSGEYFVAKLLVKGEIPKPHYPKRRRRTQLSDFEKEKHREFNIYDFYKFTLTVDDLPPEIDTCELPYTYISDEFQYGPDFSTIIAGLVIIGIDFFIGYLLFSFKDFEPNLFLFKFKVFFSNFSFLSFCTIIAWIFVILLLVIGFGLGMSDIGNLKKRNKPKFKLPKKLTNHRIPFHPMRIE